ncbi:hypothetical protein OV203_41200 [Nannocystis sp. ILAH1]|uniref:hypothetical protein n=1 Tax=unclassified Nannocystis TaxID=2627009 RepID=UPI002270E0B7|nr:MULTISPECIES: hypothetical protein [unclassified Nannocystis]MCY0986642.1 hypothetical protein [Nannocystis sp. ILAH1]MCY0993628.1 hypothetical protein [Nannocystis sp. ILAH1]MCY1071523.1 hypothetical protein [Nannocystis sp. RBIL2]
MTQKWPEFAALRRLHGEDYTHQRDRVLADPTAVMTYLPAYAGDPDWLWRTLAAIVRGWSEHAALYRQVLAELDQVNVAAEGRKVTGISRIWTRYGMKARNDYGPAILPLCWEVILKFGDLWPQWKVITFLEMISAVPKAESVEPVLTFMQEVAPIDFIEAATNTLRDLPTADVQPALVARIVVVEAAVRARGSLDPRSAELLRIWSKLRQEAADDLPPPP